MTTRSSLSEELRSMLLKVAHDSIVHGLDQHQALPVDPEQYPPELRKPQAVFVTLMSEADLRGCVGVMESTQPLVVNVAQYAYAAAFNDSRFPPLARGEMEGLHIAISLLSALEPVTCASEEELLRKIRPGVDGLLLEDGLCRGTLLPAVWEDIPEPREFLRRLKLKAGMRAHEWSPTMRVHRYTTECVE